MSMLLSVCGGAVRAYVLMALAPAELEHFCVVPYKGDTYPTSTGFRMGVCPEQTFGGVAWLRAEVASLDPGSISVTPC